MSGKNSKRFLYILRAVPGAGKSTLAESISPYVCCADDFLMENGEYKWSADKLSKAHKDCENLCREYMLSGKDKVVIANTNAHLSDTKAYRELAEEFGYTVFYLIVENRHGGVDLHNVPTATKEKMANAIKQNMKLL
jgi:predicted kinase